MEVLSARLCCIFGGLLLATSLFAQTTMIKRTATNKTKSKSYRYIPYGSVSSHSDGYQRKKVPTTGMIDPKNYKGNEKTEGGYTIKRAPVTSTPDRRILAGKRDTTSFQLYSQVLEYESPKVSEQKEVRMVVNKTLPLSCLRQNGSLK